MHKKTRTMKEIKITALLVFFFFGNVKAMAQEWDHEYIPFVEDGKIWNCCAHTPEVGVDEINCIFTMKGDTLIDENHYKKVFCQFKEYYGDDKQHYYCAVREESYRVFIIAAETNMEKLLYDFSHPQESLILSYDDYKFARGIGYHNKYIPTRQMSFWLYSTKDGMNYDHQLDNWIEGVGFINVNPFTCKLICDKPSLGYPIEVISCVNEGDYFFYIYWFEDHSAIKNTLKSVTNALIYDLQGRRLSGQPTKGIYIQNGTKIVIK